MDLAIRHGTIASASAVFAADVGVADGQIVQVGGDVPAAAREIDASGKLVLPGGGDIHTQLTSRPDWQPVDDFARGTRAAAAGGVTTVCDFAWQAEGEGLRPALERALADARRSIVDFTFHTVVVDPSAAALAQIPELVADG